MPNTTSTTQNPFLVGTPSWNLTEQCKLAKSDPDLARHLRAEAKVTETKLKSPAPAPTIPPDCWFNPHTGQVELKPAPAQPASAPEPQADRPPPTLSIPAAGADLQAAFAAVVAAVKESGGRDGFHDSERHLDVLSRLADAEDSSGQGGGLSMLTDAASTLSTYGTLVPAEDARLARLLAAVTHAARYAANAAGVPVAVDTVNDALAAVEWRRRRLAPAPFQEEPKTFLQFVGPDGVFHQEDITPAAPVATPPTMVDAPTAPPSDAVDAAPTPADPAPTPPAVPATVNVEADERWLRLTVLVATSGGKISVRDLRRAGFPPEEVRALVDARPAAGLALQTITAGKGGRPSLVLVKAART